LSDVHDVHYVGSRGFAIATYDNAVLELGHLWSRRRALVLPGGPDSWHLNCIEDVDGEIYASALRRGGDYCAWRDGLENTGVVFSLRSGKVVADGLSGPHSPRFVDGRWLICNAALGELVEVDPTSPSRIVRRVGLGTWTRGLAVDGDYCYVGVSQSRAFTEDASPTAFVAIVDRMSFSVADRIPIPSREIYDVHLVPSWTIESLRRPAASLLDEKIGKPPMSLCASRPSVASLDAPCDARASIRARFPRTVRCGSLFHIPVTVTNLGRARWLSTGEHPVHLSYRWQNADGAAPISTGGEEPIRTDLVLDVDPGTSLSAEVLVRAPAIRGYFRLRITLVAEHLAWFDDIDRGNADEEIVHTTSKPLNRRLRR
jgi:hypothetical protein